jgi:hypothetical protein
MKMIIGFFALMLLLVTNAYPDNSDILLDEARAEYNKYLNSRFVRYASGDFFSCNNFESHIGRKGYFQIKGLSSELVQQEPTYIERLNGVEWIGMIELHLPAIRSITLYSDDSATKEHIWSEWNNGNPVKVKIKKKNGSWRIDSAHVLYNAVPSPEEIDRILKLPMEDLP